MSELVIDMFACLNELRVDVCSPFAVEMIELKTICEYENCARKATMVARYVDGKLVTEGEKVVIGGEHYKVYCRKHFRKITGLI